MELFIAAVLLILLVGAFVDARQKDANKKTREDILSNSTPREVKDTPSDLSPENELSMYRKTKSEYLQSTEWQLLRNIILDRAGHKCEQCGSTKNLNIHHIHYKTLFREASSDVVCVCGECHTAIHNKYGYPKTVKEYNNFYGPLN